MDRCQCLCEGERIVFFDEDVEERLVSGHGFLQLFKGGVQHLVWPTDIKIRISFVREGLFRITFRDTSVKIWAVPPLQSLPAQSSACRCWSHRRWAVP